MLSSRENRRTLAREAVLSTRKARASAQALRRMRRQLVKSAKQQARTRRNEDKQSARRLRFLARQSRKELKLLLRQYRRASLIEIREMNARNRELLKTTRAAALLALSKERARAKEARKKSSAPRTRFKDPREFWYQNYDAAGLPIPGQTGTRINYCDSLTDNRVKPCNLFREQFFPVSGRDVTTLGNSSTYVNLVHFYVNWNATMSYWLPYTTRLRNKKLPTSNDADLLTALAELDETLAMVSTKAKSSISYGGVKWGWMPLVSDITACNDAANKVKESVLTGNSRVAKYRVNDRFTVKTPAISAIYGKYTHEWDVEVKYRGTVTYENDILAFYDYMGFHPSPKILWDIVPLSFALDWILPVGDILKALSPPKGWVKAANFTGWRIIKATCTEKRVYLDPFMVEAAPTSKVVLTSRQFLNGITLEEKLVKGNIEVFKAPNIYQLFDLAYLSKAFSNRFTDLLKPHVYKKRSPR